MSEIVHLDSERVTAAHHDALVFVRRALDTLDTLIRENQTDTVGLIRTKCLLDVIRRDSRALHDEAERLALDTLAPKETIDVDGMRWKRTASPKREWDPEGVERFLSIVVRRALANIDDQDDPVDAVIDALLSVLGKTNPKITAVRAYGADPDDISETTWSRPSLKAEPIVMTELTPTQLQAPQPREGTR